MDAEPTCPVCGKTAWATLGSRVYRRDDIDSLNSFNRLRYEVLFEVWMPDASELTTTSQLCEECGFVIYSPRPTVEEVDAKYQYLVSRPNRIDSRPAIDSALTEQRATTLFQILRPWLKPSASRVLDFGGDDGRLLRHFVSRGDHCFIVDYVRETLPGITKLGDTLDEIKPQDPFGVIVCSHVLEHVIDPYSIVSRLRKLLAPEGVLFVEVPMEIWKNPPLLEEPVTHVNFFTHVSMAYLLARAGLHVRRCRTEGLALPRDGGKLRSCVVRALATASRQPSPLPENGADLVRDLLNPGLGRKLWQAMKHPGAVPTSLWNQFMSAGTR